MRKGFIFKIFLGGLVACPSSASTLGWAETLFSEDWDSGTISASDWTK